MHLIARKRMTYNHRSMKVGDVFEVADDLHARMLIVRKKAKQFKSPLLDTPQPITPTDEMEPESLHDEARSLGIAVDGRWGHRRLRAEIDLARSDKK